MSYLFRPGRLAMLCLSVLILSVNLPRAEIGYSASNPIQIENARSGTTAWLLSKAAQGHELEGYASATSARAGDIVRFSVSTTAPMYTPFLYRMGWYGGKGGRLIEKLPRLSGHLHRVPPAETGSGLIAADWPPAFSIRVKPVWVSGVYLVKLVASNGVQAYIPLVIRSTARTAFLFIRAVATDQAYNVWGGKSLYGDQKYDVYTPQGYLNRAVKVSFDRPFSVYGGSGLFFVWEYSMVRWLEHHGRDVSYATDVDVHRDPNLLLHHQAIVIAGHDEYWSKEMRDHYDAAVRSGVSLGVFAGNTSTLAIRFEARKGKRDRVEVCYKDLARDPLTRVDPTRVTIKWRDPPLSRPESILLGAMYSSLDLKHPASWVAQGTPPWAFKGTNLSVGAAVAGLVGYEYDRLFTDYPHPATVTVLSASPVLSDYGQHDVSNSTIYVAASGARVFNAGTIFWPLALDTFVPRFATDPSHHPVIESVPIQTLTARLLNCFAVRDKTRLAGACG